MNFPWFLKERNIILEKFFLELEKHRGKRVFFSENQKFFTFCFEKCKKVFKKSGILTTKNKIEREIKTWNEKIKKLRKSINEKGYLVFDGILSPIQLKSVQKYFRSLRKVHSHSGFFTLVDDGCISYIFHIYFLFIFIYLFVIYLFHIYFIFICYLFIIYLFISYLFVSYLFISYLFISYLFHIYLFVIYSFVIYSFVIYSLVIY